MSERREYNELKFDSLRLFEKHGWLTPPEYAILIHKWPVRSSYSYLLHLYRQGLLERRGDTDNTAIRYRLSPGGKKRLAWLRSPQSKAASL